MQRPPPKFNSSRAPSNYVAGLGRGAIGFTTRSDIGPASGRTAGTVPGGLQQPNKPNFGVAPAGYVAGVGRGSGGFGETKPNAQTRNTDGGDYSETNYDEFQGFSGSLFANSTYDAEDRKADSVWESIDDRMDGRRKRRREEKAKEALEKYRKERPKISDQFADLKQELGSVSMAEWDAIPDANSGVKRKKKESFTPVTDSILTDQLAKTGSAAMASQIDLQEPAGGASSSASGGISDLSGLSAARDKILKIKLDKMSDSVSGQTVVDPKGYLTGLDSMKVTSGAEIGDIKKARLLLKSVTSTNRKHAPGWIAAARMEEYAGKMVQARKVIREGCEACPQNEDVWLEAARLNTPANAKVILANAARKLPNSVKIWIMAADLEGEADTTNEQHKNRRKAVLRRALESIPNSLKLWQAAVELENEEDAKIMLARAVECVPQSVELWLALARLETYENAKKVLNKARAAIPTDPVIWVAAAQLNEANGFMDNLQDLMNLAVREMSNSSVVVDRDAWLRHAQDAEESGSPLTSAAIVRATISLGIERVDWERTWLNDANAACKKGHHEMARVIYHHLEDTFPKERSIWLRAADFERKHGTTEKLLATLNRAVEHCPDSEILWLMTAKETWLAGDVPAAQAVLERAFTKNHSSEAVYLAAVKLMWENDQFARARALLGRARAVCPTPRVWLKSALLELECNDVNAVTTHLEEAHRKFPEYAKFWMMSGQVLESQDRVPEARKVYLRGLEHCRDSIPLWLLTCRLEEKATSVVKARSILELARMKNPKNELLWLEAVRLERRAGEIKMSETLMAKALQQCPKSGVLWAEHIKMTPRSQQKSVSNDAIKACDNDPHVVVAIAKLLWKKRKYDRARKWFLRAVALNPDFGDAWATFYKFELQDGTAQGAEEVVKKAVEADPKHGEVWCSVCKTTKNRRLPTDKVLGLVAATIED